MNDDSFLKEHKAFMLLSALFLAWMVFLIVMAFLGERTVIFYDALSQSDVSSQYFSRLSASRYLLEPFTGLSLILENDYEWILGFALLYIPVRASYIVLKRTGRIKSEKAELAWNLVRDILRFSFIVIGLIVLISLLILWLGLLIVGFAFVNLTFMTLIQAGIPLGFVLIGIKTFYVLVKVFHPHMSLQWSSRKRNQPIEPSRAGARIWRGARREASVFFGISLLLLGTNLMLVSTHWPTQTVVTELEEDEFLFDFHVHTIMSDGWLTPRERLEWYIENGIDGAAFSDHDNLRGVRMAQEYVEKHDLDFIVWTAEEWTDHENNIHMNLFGLEETIVPLESKNSVYDMKAMNASDTIKYVKEHGGYVIVNHYNDRPNPNGGIGTPYTYEQLRDWGVDGFEIVNGGGVQEAKIREFCVNNSLICMSASDIHTNEQINAFVKLRLDDPEDLSLDNVFENLYRNDHEAIAINYQPNRVQFDDLTEDILEELNLEVLKGIMNYFLNSDPLQVVSWMAWSAGAYVVLCFLYKKNKDADVKKMRKSIL